MALLDADIIQCDWVTDVINSKKKAHLKSKRISRKNKK